ncbi:DUF559 domain-containing protein [Nocardioides sp. YIM 152588]|uniref:DUF559 domain-containing protein n=1 Tax=Nocardioides sp. YIM 152588 TaxID=3158259 RepID=UPI0032E40A94
MNLPDLPHHPFLLRDAALLGITERQLQRAAAQGQVCRKARGVYVRTDLADSVELRAQVVALAASPHHVAVDRTAAWLHGVDALTYAEHDLLPPVETCALRGHHPTERSEARGRTRDLLPSDVVDVFGVLTTTPLRTALDLGCHLRRREAYAAMCALARLHGLHAHHLVTELPRFRGRRGVIQCRALAPLVDPRIESAREAWTLLAIADAGLPRPLPQYWVEIDGAQVYRLDLAYVRAKVAIEYDGKEAHASPAQRQRDQDRREHLAELGWTVVVIRLGDFSEASLRRWLGEVRAALGPSYTNRRW